MHLWMSGLLCVTHQYSLVCLICQRLMIFSTWPVEAKCSFISVCRASSMDASRVVPQLVCDNSCWHPAHHPLPASVSSPRRKTPRPPQRLAHPTTAPSVDARIPHPYGAMPASRTSSPGATAKAPATTECPSSCNSNHTEHDGRYHSYDPVLACRSIPEFRWVVAGCQRPGEQRENQKPRRNVPLASQGWIFPTISRTIENQAFFRKPLGFL